MSGLATEEPAAFAAPQALDRQCLKLGYLIRSLAGRPGAGSRGACARVRRAAAPGAPSSTRAELDADVVVVGAGPAGTSTALNW